MSHRIAAAAALALIALSGAAAAQTMKPGLWEVNNRVKSADGKVEQAMAQAQAQMAAMPPAQRKMMEDMMAKQGVGLSAGGGTTAKICLTQQMLATDGVPAQPQGNCRNGPVTRSGNTMKFSYSCTDPVSSGEGTVTVVSPESYTMKMAMSTAATGKSENMTMDANGKWLSADCGAIKPLMPPAKK